MTVESAINAYRLQESITELQRMVDAVMQERDDALADLQNALEPKEVKLQVDALRTAAVGSHLVSGRYEYTDFTKMVLEAANGLQEQARQIRNLTGERDHARRMACTQAIQMGGVFRRVENRTVECTTAREVADLMGWDCFKQEDESWNA